MTAKEALKARIEELGEEGAAALLPLADSAFLEWIECLSRTTTTEEFLKLPVQFQSLLDRYEDRFHTAEHRAEAIALAEEWQAGAGADIDLLDERSGPGGHLVGEVRPGRGGGDSVRRAPQLS